MKKTKKIITFISLLLVLIMFLPKFVEAKDISSRSELTSGPNVGNRIYLGIGKNNGTVSMFKESDHLYCVQHRADTEDAWYRVDAYVEINGTNATAYTGSNGKTVKTANSSVNTVLAYVCGEQNYYKGYNNSYTDDGVRMRAIHKYLQTWYNSVGFSKLGIDRKWNDSGFSLDNHKPVKQKALNLISDGQNYAKNTNSNAPKIDKNSTTKEIEQISETTYGPFKVKYDGVLESVVVKDNSGNAINNVEFSTDAQGKNTVKAANLKSNVNYYIQNKSGKLLKTVNIKLKDSEVLSAKIWFLERNNGARSQRFITVDTGKTKAQGETYVMNIIPIVSVKGYVWVDVQRTKANNTNGFYDEGSETRVAGVTVNLVKKSSNKTIATTKTDANGEYIFEKLLTTKKLKDYYVEFNYNGVKAKYVNLPDDSENKQEINEDISKYIPVAFNSENINNIRENGSRAIMNEVATKDKDLSGKANTYTGTAKEKIYGLGAGGNLYTKLISKDGTVLNNINLGLKRIPDAQFDVREELAYVKIGIKGYEYKYIYNNTEGDTTKVAAPRVKWQNNEAYTRDIYPSDIAYTGAKEEQLKVSVVYDIYVTNTNKTEIEELYKEKDLKITKVVNTFDSNRYELDDDRWVKDKEGEGKSTAIMKTDYINQQCGNGIGKDQSAKFNIQFNVKREELLRILQNPKGIVEKYPTNVDVIGYHDYTRIDYSWKNDIKKEQNHITKEYTEKAEAPYLIFKLGEERILSGNVFEDIKDSSRTGEVVGNGKYDNGEKNVDDVKVELLDIDKDGNLVTSHIYPATYIEDKTKVNVITQPAVTLSDNGKYTIRGIVPGKYYLRFTYGNGTCKIIDPATNQEVDKNFISKIENQNINIKDYKSTIVNKDVKDIVNNNGEEWYKKLDNNVKYSVALDNLETRKSVNYPEEGKTVENMDALTSKFSISIENTPSSEIAVTEEGEKVLSLSNKFESMNFGIIRQPEHRAEIEKLITNVKLTNAQNNLVFNGNPETATIVGVTDLDGKTNGGSSYTRVEIAEDSIYGSKIEITYQVKITNTSDLNYYNKEYYNYGEADTNKEVMFQPTEVVDYLDNTLTYIAEKSNSERIKYIETNDVEIYGDIVKAQAFELNGWKPLYTKNSKGKSEEQTSDKLILAVERILSNQDSDMEIVSKAVLNKGQNVPSGGQSDLDNIGFKATRPATDVHSESSTRLTITPPTGEDRKEIILYTIAGTIAFAILGAGIVMIKKIVTK